MATASVVPTVVYSAQVGLYTVIGTLAIDASPDEYTTGGITVDFTDDPLCKATKTPIWVDIVGEGGYVYQYDYGADATAGKVKIFQQSAATSALTEIPAAAIPAGVSGDTIHFKAQFLGMR